MTVILNEGENAAHIDIAAEVLSKFLVLMPTSYRIVASLESPRQDVVRLVLASRFIKPGTSELLTNVNFELKASA